MSEQETYQGWTNRETWAVALHINNDQGWQESVREAIRTAQDEYRVEGCDACEGGETHALPAHEAGALIRENVEESLDFEDPASRSFERIQIAQEIGSLWRVNWTELGASFLEDLEDE